MFRTACNDVSLFGGRTAASPRPSFQPAVEALEERVVPSSSISLQHLNGLYQLTVAVAGQSAPATTEFRMDNGVFTLSTSIKGVSITLGGRLTLVDGDPHLSGNFSVSGALLPLSGSWSISKGSLLVNGVKVGTGILTSTGRLEINASVLGITAQVQGQVAFHGVPGASGTFGVSGLATASGSWSVVRIGP
jgi:hypothetical protein